MVTFTIGLGLGELSYQRTYEEATSGDFFDIKQGTKKWPVPAADSPSALDDLWHAAVNGRGVFFSAKNPGGPADGLTDTLSQLLRARAAARPRQPRTCSRPRATSSPTLPLTSRRAGPAMWWRARSTSRPARLQRRPVVGGDPARRPPVHEKIYAFGPTDITGNKLKNFCWPLTGGAGCADGLGLDATEQARFNPNQLQQFTGWNALQKTAATPQSLVDYPAATPRTRTPTRGSPRTSTATA